MTTTPLPPPTPQPDRPETYPAALAQFNQLIYAMTAEILTTPDLARLASAATTLSSLATTTIAQLRGELDAYHGRTVLHTTEANATTAAFASTAEAPGTILRATDTGREWVLTEGHDWLPRAP